MFACPFRRQKNYTSNEKKKWKCDWNVNTSSRKIITKMIKYVLLCDSFCLWATFSCELFVTSYLIVCDCMERNVTSLSDLNYFSWKIVSSRILSSIQNYIFYEMNCFSKFNINFKRTKILNDTSIIIIAEEDDYFLRKESARLWTEKLNLSISTWSGMEKN